MYGCEKWTIKKAECWRIDAFELWCWEQTLESPLDFKEIKSVNHKGNQFWIFIGRTDAEAEIPIFWPPDVKNWLLGKDHDAGKDWRHEEKGTTEDEMVRQHHRRNEHELSKLWEVVIDREAGRAAVHGVTKSQTQLSDWPETEWGLSPTTSPPPEYLQLGRKSTWSTDKDAQQALTLCWGRGGGRGCRHRTAPPLCTVWQLGDSIKMSAHLRHKLDTVLLGIYLGEMKAYIHEKTYKSVHNSFTYNKPNLETTHSWINKATAVYPHNRILTI